MPTRGWAFAAGLLLIACGSHEASPPAPRLEVWGQMGTGRQSIGVWHDGVEVGDAVVEVDGQPMYPVCAGCGWYEGSILPAPVAGDTLSLTVTRGASVVTGTGIVPEAPVLTSPADGTFSPSDPIAVAWTSSSEPDRFEVDVRHTCHNASATSAFDASGAARALTIPANAFSNICSVPLTLAVSVRAVNAGSLRGDYLPYSGGRGPPGMNIAAGSYAATLQE